MEIKYMRINIIGAGSHALVIADILHIMNEHCPINFVEKDELVKNSHKDVTPDLAFPVYAQNDFFRDYNKDAHGYLILGLGAGLISIRKKIIERFSNEYFTTAIHPRAVIAESVKVGAGTVVMAGVILNPYTKIGCHIVINTAATVDHECDIGDNTFIQPGAHLAGNVKVGNNTIIGIGANIKEGVVIGSNSIIGGGSFVNRDVPDNAVYVGVPSRKLRDN